MIQGRVRLYCRIARGLGDIDLAIFRKSATDPGENDICYYLKTPGVTQRWETGMGDISGNFIFFWKAILAYNMHILYVNGVTSSALCFHPVVH